MRVGQTAEVCCYEDCNECGVGSSWLRGSIEQQLASGDSVRLFVVRPHQFKWIRESAYGPYDGVPLVLALETAGRKFLLWVDQWPPRELDPL